MIVREGEVEALELPIGITAVQVDTAVSWHEVECFVQNGQRLLEALLFVERRAHVIVGEANLHGHFLLELLRIHELGSAFQIT